jgi:hypothetical protein
LRIEPSTARAVQLGGQLPVRRSDADVVAEEVDLQLQVVVRVVALNNGAVDRWVDEDDAPVGPWREVLLDPS